MVPLEKPRGWGSRPSKINPSFIYLFVCLFIHSCLHSFVHSFLPSFIHPSIHSFLHSFLSFIHSLHSNLLHSIPFHSIPFNSNQFNSIQFNSIYSFIHCYSFCLVDVRIARAALVWFAFVPTPTCLVGTPSSVSNSPKHRLLLLFLGFPWSSFWSYDSSWPCFSWVTFCFIVFVSLHVLFLCVCVF